MLLGGGVVGVLRWLSIVEALLLIGWSIAVIQEAKKFRPPNVYVRLITGSYILLVVISVLHSFGRSDSAAVVVLRVLALTYGLVAMAAMYHHYRYDERVRRHAAKSDGAAERMREKAGIPPRES